MTDPQFSVGDIVWWHCSENVPAVKVRVTVIGNVFHQVEGLNHPGLKAAARVINLEPLSVLDRLATEL